MRGDVWVGLLGALGLEGLVGGSFVAALLMMKVMQKRENKGMVKAGSVGSGGGSGTGISGSGRRG